MAEGQGQRGFATAALIAGLGLALSGCAYSMSEFAQSSPTEQPTNPVALGETAPPVETTATTAAPAVPLQPTALVEDEAPPLPRLAPTETASASAAVAAPLDASGYPNINAVPPHPAGKLLTAEEKAKVIAELEAMAREQGVQTAKVRKAQLAAQAECDQEAAKTLDPEARLKDETEGLQC